MTTLTDTLWLPALHINFYENWMPAGTVRVGVDEVAQFVALMAEVE